MDNPVVAPEPDYPGGFDDFFRSQYREIVTVLMVMEGASLADADDCVAHAMEKLLERWNSDPGYVRRPRAYVMTIAKRQFRRDRHRAQAVTLDEIESVLGADEPAFTAVESRQLVADILGCLPPAQLPVMYLITEGYTTAEIAEILRKNPNNVRQITYQAKKRLRPLLELRTTELPQGEEEL